MNLRLKVHPIKLSKVFTINSNKRELIMLVFKSIIFLLSFLFCSLVFATSQTIINKPVSKIEKIALEKEKIRSIQKKLKHEGYYLGSINGEKTLETRRAFKNWAMDRD